MNPPTVSDASNLVLMANDLGGPMAAFSVGFLIVALIVCYLFCKDASNRAKDERTDRIAAQKKVEEIAEKSIIANVDSTKTNEAMVKSLDLLSQRIERFTDAQRAPGAS